MDGSDAVEFFEAYRDGFEVDLSELYAKWDDYFRSETSVNLITFLISAPIAFGLIVVLKALPGQIRPQWLSFLLAIVPAVLLDAFWRHRFGYWPGSIVFPETTPQAASAYYRSRCCSRQLRIRPGLIEPIPEGWSMISGLSHITLSVRQLARSYSFYVDMLGCRPIARRPRGAYLTAGDLWLCLIIQELHEKRASPRIHPLCLPRGRRCL